MRAGRKLYIYRADGDVRVRIASANHAGPDPPDGTDQVVSIAVGVSNKRVLSVLQHVWELSAGIICNTHNIFLSE